MTTMQQQVDASQSAHTNAHAAGMTQYLTHFRYPAVGESGQRMLSPMDTCVTRGLVGGVMGGGMGVVFGMLMHMSGPMGGLGAMPQVPGVPNPQLNAPPPPPTPAAAAATPARPGVNPGAIGASASAASTAASSASVVATPALSGGALPSSSSTAASASLFRPSIGGLGPQPRPLPLGVPSSSGIGMADPIYGMAHTPEVTSWNQVKAMARDTGRMAKGNFKTWGIMSGSYATSECVIEKARGKSDELNPLLAGCSTGAFLAARSGPQGMAIGCAGFAAFSYAIEKAMHAMG